MQCRTHCYSPGCDKTIFTTKCTFADEYGTVCNHYTIKEWTFTLHKSYRLYMYHLNVAYATHICVNIGSTLAAPRLYQCKLIITGVLWHTSDGNYTRTRGLHFKQHSHIFLGYRVNPLRAKFFRGNIKHIFTFHVIPLYWYDTGGWNPSSNKTRTYPFYIVNIMAAVPWRRKEPGHQQLWYWPS